MSTVQDELVSKINQLVTVTKAPPNDIKDFIAVEQSNA